MGGELDTFAGISRALSGMCRSPITRTSREVMLIAGCEVVRGLWEASERLGRLVFNALNLEQVHVALFFSIGRIGERWRKLSCGESEARGWSGCVEGWMTKHIMSHLDHEMLP